MRARESFRSIFWYTSGQYVHDTVNGSNGNDAYIRPNQSYAISLCDDLLARHQAQQIPHIVTDHLLTPLGLRTLSPQDTRYHPRY